MSTDTPRPKRVTLSDEEREVLARSVAATINYHSFDAAAETADFDMADAILDTNLAATSAGLAVTVERILAGREQALREKIAGLKATLEQVERAVPVCTFDLYEGVCGDLVGGKFPNGAEFTEGMCCVPCRVRRIVRGETR